MIYMYRAMTFTYRDTHCMLFTLPFSSCLELFTSCNNFLHKKRVIINHLPQKLKTACQHFLSELYIHVHVYEMQDLKRVMYSIIEIFTWTSLKYSQTKFLLKIHIITGNYILSSHLLIIGYFKISDQFCLFFTV